MLNCILTERRILKAMRSKYRLGDIGKKLTKPRNRKQAEYIKISNAHRANGAHSKRELIDAGKSFSQLQDGRLVWIRGCNGPQRIKLKDIAVQLKIPWRIARPLVAYSTEPDLERNITTEAWGIVVYIQDACAVLTRYCPEWLDNRRAEIYDCDTH